MLGKARKQPAWGGVLPFQQESSTLGWAVAVGEQPQPLWLCGVTRWVLQMMGNTRGFFRPVRECGCLHAWN